MYYNSRIYNKSKNIRKLCIKSMRPSGQDENVLTLESGSILSAVMTSHCPPSCAGNAHDLCDKKCKIWAQCRELWYTIVSIPLSQLAITAVMKCAARPPVRASIPNWEKQRTLEPTLGSAHSSLLPTEYLWALILLWCHPNLGDQRQPSSFSYLYWASTF